MNPQVLAAIEKMAGEIAYSCRLCDADRDDLVQEGCLVAFHASEWPHVMLQVRGAMLNHLHRFILKMQRDQSHDADEYAQVEYVEYEDRQVSPYPTPEEHLMVKETILAGARVIGLSDRRVRQLKAKGLLAA